MIANSSSPLDTGRTGREVTQQSIPFDQILFVVCASLIIAATIFGNVLVIITVFAESKLRKVGNFFIVSLAISDLLVGLFVTPVALVYDLIGSWTFGMVFCDFWIAMDVICCTASIVNLCVISFDRYNAITQPLRYALRRTASRAGMIIATIWTYSIIIAIPPFLGWSDPHAKSRGSCTISQNIGYTIFSTVGAYYLPLIVMIITYFKVFRATLKRKRNWIPLVRQETDEQRFGTDGIKQPKIRKARVLINVADSSDHDTVYEDCTKIVTKPKRGSKVAVITSMNLNRGRNLGVTIQAPTSEESLATTPSPDFREHNRYVCSSVEETSIDREASRELSRKMLSVASSTESAGEVSDESGYECSPQLSPGGSVISPRTSAKKMHSHSPLNRSSSEKRILFQKRMNPSFTYSTDTTPPTTGSEETLPEAEGRVRFSFSRRSCKFQFKVESEIREEENSHEETPAVTKTCPLKIENSDDGTSSVCINPMTMNSTDKILAKTMKEKVLTIERGRRRLRHLRRRKKNRISLNQERRAAKTLGIIMGCFVVCWLPFFILAVMKPLCDNCSFDPIMVKAFTWLGYLNSALNPIIYTFFNQDFRNGFQRIICCSTKR